VDIYEYERVMIDGEPMLRPVAWPSGYKLRIRPHLINVEATWQHTSGISCLYCNENPADVHWVTLNQWLCVVCLERRVGFHVFTMYR